MTEAAGAAATATVAPAKGGAARRGPVPVALFSLVLGLVVTAALFGVSLAVYDRNESRLLELRVRELGLVLSGAQSTTQTPLESATELADATNGSRAVFEKFMAPYVVAGGSFVSASLWRLGGPETRPLAVVGVAPTLAADPKRIQALFATALRIHRVGIAGVLRATDRLRLGYAFALPGVGNRFAVYAENTLPKDRRSRLASNTGFASLNYAIYLGRSRQAKNLLVTNMQAFPIRGRQASEYLSYGSTFLTLVVTPDGTLGGGFFERLPVTIAIIGALLSLAAAAMTDRLARRRLRAEQLAAALDEVAGENRRMYTQQRGIAQTLQHALLPEALPEINGLEASVLYLPAGPDLDIGGDWYDVLELDAGRALFIVGDVSGHGLGAATTMAALRYAARAYATERYGPGDLLAKLSDFVGRSEHEYFATVLCGLIDVDSHRLTLACAGHLAPLLIEGDHAVFVALEVGVPIGVERDVPYAEVSVSVAPGAVLLAFTDGLVERRGEALDDGLARLRVAALAHRLPLDDLVHTLGRELASSGPQDDTAIVGLRWTH
jgi:serine phosphatase RsbU (regulator of sigma subunit)